MALETGVVPASLLSRPALQTFDAEVWNAFNRLASRRGVSGFGAVSAIPYVEIAAYLDRIARIHDEEERAVFIEIIEFLDDQFLKDYAERQKQEQQKSKGKGGSSSKSR